MRLVLIISLIIALVAVVFAMQNPGEMTLVVPFTGSQLTGSQPVILISTLIIGLVIGLLASLPGRIGAGMRARKAEKKLEELSKGSAPAKAVTEAAPEPKVETPANDQEDASETQRLADEVARRTAEAQQSGPPPLDP